MFFINSDQDISARAGAWGLYLKRSLLILFYSILSYGVNAQPGIKITAEQSPMYAKEVFDICKDARGKMWVTTWEGLMVCDGFEMIQIAEFKNATVRRMMYDDVNNEIWLVADKKLVKVDCETYKTETISTNGKPVARHAVNVQNKKVYAVCYDSSMVILNTDGQIQKTVNTPAGINDIVALPNGRIYLSDKKRLYIYNETTNRINGIQSQKKLFSPFDLWNTGDTLLFGTWISGLQLLDGDSLINTTPDDLQKINSENQRLSAAAIKNGMLFAAFSNYSFFILDPANHWEQNIATEYSKVFYGRKYNCIFSDGNIVWIGTNNGLIKVTIHKELFSKILTDSIPSISTRSIIQSNGTMYVASYSGIFYFDSLNKKWQNLNNQFKGNYKYLTPYSMLQSGPYIYMGMESKFLYRYDKTTRTLTDSFYTVSENKPLGLAATYCMVQDDKGIIWIGTKAGIASYNTALNTLNYHDHDRFHLDSSVVRHLEYQPKPQRLLAATDKGLYIVDLKNDNTRHIWNKTTPGFENNNLQYVCADNSNNIWVATKGAGVYILSSDLHVTKHITIDDGLPDNVVCAILFDNNNIAWMSTYNGLCRYDIHNNTFSNYYQEDGLSNNEFNHNSFLKDHVGNLYFGTIDGVNILMPGILKSLPAPFSVYVSGIKNWTVKGDEITIPVSTQTVFEKLSSSFSMGIMLGISDHNNDDKTIFLYKIAGVNEHWQRVKNPHMLRMDGLPYGNYEVTIKALNDRGQTSANILKIQVHLLAPFYYRWWFFVLLLLVLAAIAYGIFRYKINALKSYQDLRVQIASDLHDEVGSLLTSIGMYSDNLNQGNASATGNKQKIEKISSLSRTAILSMRDILWAIDARNDVPINLVEHIRNHAEEMLLPKDVNIHFKFQADATQRQLNGKIRQHLYFITREAINNIVKHSNAANVYINFIINRDHFDVEIANDGVIKDARSPKGQGLKNMKARAEKMKAIFTWEIKAGTFIVRVKR